MADAIEVPKSWMDFLTINLLHRTRFDWTKTLL
jgi:hypothetical protein